MKKISSFLLLSVFCWQTAQSQSDSSFIENINGVTFKMIKVQGGSFQMGNDSGEESEKPSHTVTLTDYYIAETEVTQALWQAVMGENPSHTLDCDACPVEQISWNDIVNIFLPKLEKLTGKKYRLPTEAEWEYAAKGGKKSKNYAYAGSNDISQVAWYTANSFDKGKKHVDYGTHPVKTKAPNELGLYDMTGNVWEWCQDGYDEKFYRSIAASATNPINNNAALLRVLRGGAWDGHAARCRVDCRSSGTSTRSHYIIGFRICVIL